MNAQMKLGLGSCGYSDTSTDLQLDRPIPPVISANSVSSFKTWHVFAQPDSKLQGINHGVIGECGVLR